MHFESVGVFLMPGRGLVKTVVLGRDCDDFSWLVNQPVWVDDIPYTVSAVKYRGHDAPFKADEIVGLLLKELRSERGEP